MKHNKGLAVALAAASLALAAGPASASVCEVYAVGSYTVLEGATVCFRYDPGMVSPLYGSLQVSGDNIFAIPTNFRAESLNGQGVVSTTGVGTVEVIAKQGYQFVAINVGETGNYRLSGADASVDVDAELRVFDFFDPVPVFGTDEKINLTILGDLAINDNSLHAWSGFGGFDMTSDLWTEVNHVGLQLSNLLTARTLEVGSSAMIQKTATGTQITFSIVTSSEVPVPAAVWLMGSGLLGLLGVARRRKA